MSGIRVKCRVETFWNNNIILLPIKNNRTRTAKYELQPLYASGAPSLRIVKKIIVHQRVLPRQQRPFSAVRNVVAARGAVGNTRQAAPALLCGTTICFSRTTAWARNITNVNTLIFCAADQLREIIRSFIDHHKLGLTVSQTCIRWAKSTPDEIAIHRPAESVLLIRNT